MVRVFWLRSDGEAREISWNEYVLRPQNRLYVLVWKTEVCFIKGKIYLPMKKNLLVEMLKDGNVS